MALYYAQQYATTKLSVSGGIDASQTTGIVLQSVTGLDITKPGLICVGWSDPLVDGSYEFISYTSINGSNELQGVTRGAEGSTGIEHANLVDIAWVITESHINKLNDMFVTGGEGYTQISTPSNPASGFNKLYFKSDNQLYTLTSAGAERVVGSSFRAILTPQSALFPASNYPQLVKNIGTYKSDLTLDYDASTDETAEWEIMLPAGITITSATLYINYRMASATSNAVVWACTTNSIASGETWDASGTTDTFSSDTVADNTGKIKQASKALTTTGWSAGETLHIRILRDADNGSDTATGDAKLQNAILVIT